MYKIQEPKIDELNENGTTKNIKIKEGITIGRLMDYGFTNYNEPVLCYSKMVGEDISFTLVVCKETISLDRIDVLDEDFCQPYDYQMILMDDSRHEFARMVYDNVDKVLSKLQEDGIIEGYSRGMYV